MSPVSEVQSIAPGVSQRWRWAVAGVLVLASLVAAVVLTVRHPDALVTFLPSTDMHELHVDFDTFWNSAVALVHGTDIYETPAKLHNLNPPLLSVLLAPFAALDVVTAYRIWAALTLLMVVAALIAVARELRLRPLVTVLVLLAVLASSPLHGTLVLGQIYPLLLVGLVAGWIAQRRGHPVLGAVLYGVVVALKPSLAPLLLLPAAQRQWTSFRAGIAGAVVATVVGVLGAGPSSAWGWLRIAFSEGVPDSVDNASLPGLAVRFGVPSVVGMVLGVAVLVGTLWWFGKHRDRVGAAGTAPWAVLAASLLLSPIAWHNYLMLLWPGVMLLIVLGRAPITAVALAVAIIPVSWNAEWPPHGVAAAVARSLYCAILVGYWVVLVRGSALPLPGSSGSSTTGAEPSVAGSSVAAGSAVVAGSAGEAGASAS
ncbi:glycosyltransferase family 87 protein [Pseudonocardia sp. GCM10023141]|uniref:glycosyltransferase family 87 protein n=1 Tax=Pseudonocardia sp. GCM10023141 TaxID=3252653 RepID=UPI003607CA4C